MNTLTALRRCALGLDLYLWLVYRTFALTSPLRLSWPLLYGQFDADPSKAGSHDTVQYFRRKVLRELKKDQAGLAGSELRDGSGCLDLASLDTLHRTLGSTTTSKLGRTARR